MQRARGVASMRHGAARAMLLALAVLGLGRRANAADVEAQAAPDQYFALTGGMVALSLAANAELQTRWGPVVALGAGARLGPAVNAYAGDTLSLGRRWSLRPGFRFVRSWLTASDCPSGCTFDFYVGEIGLRYRGPTGIVVEYGMPLFGWIPVAGAVGETQPHLKFYTLATSELALVSTVLVGVTWDL